MDAAEFVIPHKYHAFLSYNTPDVQHVKPIADALSRAGLKLYFAPVTLRADLAVSQQMAEEMEDSGCLVLFVGPNGIGPFQRLEVNHASGRQQKIIKVILPKGSPVEVQAWFDTKVLDCNDPDVSYELIDHLIESITAMPLVRQPFQIGKNRRIKLPDTGSVESRTLTVHSLRTIDPKEKLLLNWETFGRLINNLKRQIDGYPTFYPDAYFGINPAGLVAVQFLNDHRLPIGFIHHEGGKWGRRIVTEKCTFPVLESNPEILVVDSELKSGSAMKITVQALLEKYPKPGIYYAVLGAMMMESHGDTSIENLLAWKYISEYLNDGSIQDIFIASIFGRPGIDAPLRIR